MSKPVTKIGGVTVPADLKGKDLLKWMKENLATLITEKKSAIKHSDAIPIHTDINTRMVIDKDGCLVKAAAGFTPDMSAIETVLCAINTTNWMDSHSDVHFPKIWNKSLKDNKAFNHLQEHTMKFTHIISDQSKGYVQKMTWKELGYDYPGETEVLIFASPLTGRNEYMEDQYRKGYVKNHSVGMQYVDIKFCVNEPEDEWYKVEFANWNQYIDQVVNKERAEEQGYFWAVLEAKIIEGSAVPIGSNTITPTLGFKSVQPAGATDKTEPAGATQQEEEKQDEGMKWDKMAELIAKF